jgi:hypothetical protein
MRDLEARTPREPPATLEPEAAAPLDPPSRAAIEALARWRSRFEAPDFSVGDWVKSWRDAQGVIHMGWFEFSLEAKAFLGDLGEHGWIRPFDWGAWLQSPDGKRVIHGPDGIETATPEDLRRALTAIVRSDRFTEGSIAGAFESGLLLRILRRAERLLR